MQEIFFLLLPVAAFYGWYMGVRSVYQKKKKKENKLNRDYLKGLNLLFSDQPDKAVDHFISLLDVDSDTIETHLALGNLFRQRGEVDRAIRIHQNLIARPSLTREQRDLALLQLGQDFYHSGLLDRSLDVFTQLKESPEYKELALENLLKIYQQMQDWDEALLIMKQLNKIVTTKERVTTLAYLYCCVADELFAPEDNKKKIKLYNKAIATSRYCMSARIALSAHYEAQGDIEQALEILAKIPEIDIDFTEIILDKLLYLSAKINDEEGLIKYLYRIVSMGGGASAVILLSKLIFKHRGEVQAQHFMQQELEKNPTMKGFNKLISYYLKQATGENEIKSLSFLQSLLENQIKLRAHYRCRKCGYSTARLHWLCPSCKTWGRIKPIRGLDGE
ncbi:MAG TPA: lipopolysaccharide assembly protein LapB [Psychromonas hadalis]|nr:lipopolysaccharide assembly protein LapB [Psychromonas hadalis]